MIFQTPIINLLIVLVIGIINILFISLVIKIILFLINKLKNIIITNFTYEK